MNNDSRFSHCIFGLMRRYVEFKPGFLQMNIQHRIKEAEKMAERSQKKAAKRLKKG